MKLIKVYTFYIPLKYVLIYYIGTKISVFIQEKKIGWFKIVGREGKGKKDTRKKIIKIILLYDLRSCLQPSNKPSVNVLIEH